MVFRWNQTIWSNFFNGLTRWRKWEKEREKRNFYELWWHFLSSFQFFSLHIWSNLKWLCALKREREKERRKYYIAIILPHALFCSHFYNNVLDTQNTHLPVYINSFRLPFPDSIILKDRRIVWTFFFSSPSHVLSSAEHEHPRHIWHI